MIWAQGFVELLCWRCDRKAVAAQGERLVAECQQFLAQVRRDGVPQPTDPPRRIDPPRPTDPPFLG
jgi:hypothetical protein